ncbi:MAG: type I-U CRISPR-associated helicase/endonuclease Cas3 [Candidatus Thermoplasmatota archaeon]|jgi:CRISPR-associated endonuclease/helicase Cas3|nr:type I-U CRISPR-associated helicase/endonuclease Cas3 [Candidatus Thermoplasmatota archaeon]
MNVNDFADFFREIHNCDPFPWQNRLISTVESNGWPETIVLPTSSGKTSVIDIALFSMALRLNEGKPTFRRIFFTVDRRFVVDEAYITSMKIREKLVSSMDSSNILGDVARALASASGSESSHPLDVIRIHGGIPHEPVFIRNPLQPTVVLTTVDQIGSRLLFRGYGISEYMRPIHAALTGKDSLIILDEAHLSLPFLSTLEMVKRYQKEQWCMRSVGVNANFVSMSATHPKRSGTVFSLEEKDLLHPVLSRRLMIHKPVKLIKVERGQEKDPSQRLKSLAIEFSRPVSNALKESNKNAVIGVVVNTVSLASAVFNELAGNSDIEVVKITGRVRPYERDKILENVLPKMALGRSGTESDKPLVVVSTQAIEVGANLDFDVMITEHAPIDALRQRFGRLNRIGSRTASFGEIIYSQDRLDANMAVYGDSWEKAWNWLGKLKKDGMVDFGPHWFDEIIEGHDLDGLITESSESPVLMPSHLDMLVQTSPEPAFEPDIPLLLHGTSDSYPDIQVIWRADIPDDLGSLDESSIRDIISIVPPNSYEAAPIPVWALRAFLAGRRSDISDMEGSQPLAVTGNGETKSLNVFLWKGMEGGKIISPNDLKPGQTIVMPSTYGGYDAFGWNPERHLPVEDAAEVSAAKVFGRNILRIHPLTLPSWFSGEDPYSVPECREIIRNIIDRFTSGEKLQDVLDELLPGVLSLTGLNSSISSFVQSWTATGRKRTAILYPSDIPQGILLEIGLFSPEESTTEDDTSSYTADVTLESHSQGVEKYVKHFASALGLSTDTVEDVATAGLLHDLGKADPRFQSWLYGGTAWNHGVPVLAKSSGPGKDFRAIIAARDAAGYPKGGRHECYSYAIVRKNPHLIDQRASDRDLVEYLIGSHHGRGRAMMPIVDDEGTSITLEFLGNSSVFKGAHRLERMDSGWTDLFWKMTRRYGYWGLAYLEMLVRLGDHTESEKEARDNGK